MDNGRQTFSPTAGPGQYANQPLAPVATSFNNMEPGLPTPVTPTTPGVVEGKSKKANPLNDLIDSEKIYVEQLTGIIRKVASAWSRNNLPPPELDSMFRGIEGVYKANRSLLGKLNEIGSNPDNTNPKALGDLLMRWIDDLEAPYSNYCSRYMAGFDDWPGAQSNARLPSTLAIFSASSPPPLPPGSPLHPAEPLMWTLDTLFILPKGRLKYYRKLYGRLLKSTTPGRSDHRLLVTAVDKLDALLLTLDERQQLLVGGQAQVGPGEDEVVVDMRTQSMQSLDRPQPNGGVGSAHSSMQSSGRESNFSGNNDRFSRETKSTSVDRASVSTMNAPISDLERRLVTDRTLDIFTMQPKAVRLQISPSTLPFTRELLQAADVTINLTPRSTGRPIVHQQGHIYILSDLFLVCERMSLAERASRGPEGSDMWLLYPPLAGKHLKVFEVEGQANAVQVTIMRKENLILHAESPQARDNILGAFKQCISFASDLAQAAKGPPVPPLDTMPRGFNTQPISPPLSDRAMSPPGSTRPSQEIAPLAARRFSPPARSGSLNNSPAHSIDSALSGPHPPDRQGSLPPHGPMGYRGDGPPPPSMSGQPPLPPKGPPQQYPNGPPRGPGGQGLPSRPYGPGSMPPPHMQQPGPPGPGGPPPHMRGPPGPGGIPPYAGPGGMPPPNQGPGGMPPQHQFPPGPGGFTGPGPIPPPTRPFAVPPRPDSAGSMGMRNGENSPGFGGPAMRRTASSGGLANQFEQAPMGGRPPMPGGFPSNNSDGALHAPQPRMLLPSALNARIISTASSGGAQVDPDDISPPTSPRMQPQHTGPVTSSITAQMKCKVFMQQQHAQWKALGQARLKLFEQQPTGVKQLVVERDDKKSALLISTIVLCDGVERVGKTGVAIELSDAGARTGIVYMLQLRNEQSAQGLFDSLIQGSDRYGR